MRTGISPFATIRETTLELGRIAVEGGLDTLWATATDGAFVSGML